MELIDCVGPGGFPQSDLSLLESLADFVAIALSNAKEISRRDLLAYTDEQTGFYSARYLDYWLGVELILHKFSSKPSDDGAYTFSLMCVVSDELKNLAASLTYAHYTQLLVEVGQKIEEFIKREDISRAIHSGQGKFYFFLPLDCEKACAFAQRYHKFFRDTVWLQEQGLNVRLTASIGVATCPEDGRTKAELLHSVDEALSLITSSTGDGVAAAKIGILPPL